MLEGKFDCPFIGKSCSKLATTLDIIKKYQSASFSLTNYFILEIGEYSKKSHLSNTFFPDIINHSLGKFKLH